MTFLPYDWIREIKPELKALDDIPLTGSAPPFPWDELANRLAQTFEKESVKIEPKEVQWLAKDQLYEGLGDHPAILTFAIPSMHGQAYWVMPEQEMMTLESLLLTKDPHPISFQDKTLSESFYRFLALEVLYQVSQLHFDKSLVPVLTSQKAAPQQDALGIDIAITIQDQTLWGRLLISSELRRSWVEYFAHMPVSFNQELAQKIDVTLHIEAGQFQLSWQEWQTISLGDVLLVDNYSLDKEAKDFSGRVMLTLHGKQVFRGKLKDGNIKILEFPLYHEVEAPMAKQTEDEDFPDFEDLPEEDHDLEDEDEDFDDLDLEDEDFMQDIEDDQTRQPAAPPLPSRTAPSPKEASQIPASHPTIQPDQIPLSIAVEIGRIQISIQKLMELEPGNLLELNIRPEDGVNLTVNGKVVGKGELIRIGEVLGVRILDLGR